MKIDGERDYNEVMNDFIKTVKLVGPAAPAVEQNNLTSLIVR